MSCGRPAGRRALQQDGGEDFGQVDIVRRLAAPAVVGAMQPLPQAFGRGGAQARVRAQALDQMGVRGAAGARLGLGDAAVGAQPCLDRVPGRGGHVFLAGQQVGLAAGLARIFDQRLRQGGLADAGHAAQQHGLGPLAALELVPQGRQAFELMVAAEHAARRRVGRGRAQRLVVVAAPAGLHQLPFGQAHRACLRHQGLAVARLPGQPDGLPRGQAAGVGLAIRLGQGDAGMQAHAQRHAVGQVGRGQPVGQARGRMGRTLGQRRVAEIGQHGTGGARRQPAAQRQRVALDEQHGALLDVDGALGVVVAGGRVDVDVDGQHRQRPVQARPDAGRLGGDGRHGVLAGLQQRPGLVAGRRAQAVGQHLGAMVEGAHGGLAVVQGHQQAYQVAVAGFVLGPAADPALGEHQRFLFAALADMEVGQLAARQRQFDFDARLAAIAPAAHGLAIGQADAGQQGALVGGQLVGGAVVQPRMQAQHGQRVDIQQRRVQRETVLLDAQHFGRLGEHLAQGMQGMAQARPGIVVGQLGP